MKDRILTFANRTVFWLSVLLMGFLTVVSLISTSYFNTETSFAERPQYRMDHVLLNLLVLAVFLEILFLLNRKWDLEKFPVRKLAAFAVIFVVGISILWVQISHTYP